MSPDAHNRLPYTSATGLVYDTGDYAHVLDLALAAAGYDELRAEQDKARAAGDPVQIGVGVATFIDRTAALSDPSYGAAELRPDGTVLVRTGSSPYGQGHDTAWAMLVADRTGLPLESIEVVHGDTDQVPRAAITGGSQSAQRAGSAVAAATDDLVVRARQVVADALEAAVDDIVLELTAGDHSTWRAPRPRALGWADVAEAAADPLRCEVDMATDATYPFGAYVAVVEVDTETGQVLLRRLVTVDDAGRILNPLLAEGQVHGGAAQGAAQALLEEFVYDDGGNPLTTNFADYPVISAAELPSFESSLFETTTPNNLLGAKGIAESGTIGAPPAVQNAVIDARAPSRRRPHRSAVHAAAGLASPPPGPETRPTVSPQRSGGAHRPGADAILCRDRTAPVGVTGRRAGGFQSLRGASWRTTMRAPGGARRHRVGVVRRGRQRGGAGGGRAARASVPGPGHPAGGGPHAGRAPRRRPRAGRAQPVAHGADHLQHGRGRDPARCQPDARARGGAQPGLVQRGDRAGRAGPGVEWRRAWCWAGPGRWCWPATRARCMSASTGRGRPGWRGS